MSKIYNNNRDLFMEKLFIHLPKELQIKILLSIPSWKPPKPKFKINTLVEYSLEKKKNIYIKIDELNSLKHMKQECSLSTLKIDSNSTWNKKDKDWLYLVLYGPAGRTRKLVFEKDLVLYER